MRHRLTGGSARVAAAALLAPLSLVLCAGHSAGAAAPPLPPSPTAEVIRPAADSKLAPQSRVLHAAETTLSATTFGSIAVDATYGHVYVSSPASNSVAVFDLDGTYLHSLTGLPGADQLLVDGRRLYVGLDTSGQIEIVDNSDQHFVRAMLVSRIFSPGPIVKADGYLWTTSGPCGGDPQPWVRIDPATGMWVAGSFGGLGSCLRFTGDPVSPTTLLAFDVGLGPTTVVRYSIATGSPVLVTSSVVDAANAHQLAFTPDGSRFFLAAASPPCFPVYRTDDLAPSGTVFPANAYPTAVATTGQRGGLVAFGMKGGSSGNDVLVYKLGDHSAPITGGYWTDGSETLNGGIAFSPGGSKVYVVHQAAGGGLVVTTGLVTLRPTTVNLIVPTSSTSPVPVSVQVRVVWTGPRPTGSVTLYDHGTAIRTIPLSHGNGSIHVILGRGSHDLVAYYRGSSTTGASISTDHHITVS